MQRAGVDNHMVVALDDFTHQQVHKWGTAAMQVSLNGTEESQALKVGSSHAVSGAEAHLLHAAAAAQEYDVGLSVPTQLRL